MEPINCAVIRLREGKLCPAWIIQPNNTKTIAVNCLTSRVDNKNDKCRFKSQDQAQRFLACHGTINNLFRLGRHKMQADN